MKWPKHIVDEGIKILNSLNLRNITPKKENVLKFLKTNPLNIKVVIVGQDPYPTQGVANGDAFAVNQGVKIPMSLKNIFKEIEEIQGKVYADQTLDFWKKQGVLLLNTSLSTEIGISNKHKKYWQDYTSQVISWLDESFNITWVLWGKEAARIGNKLKGKKIVDAHPSPLSVKYRKKHTFKELSHIKW